MTAHPRQVLLLVVLLFAAALIGTGAFGQSKEIPRTSWYLVTFKVTPKEADRAGGRWDRVVDQDADERHTKTYHPGDDVMGFRYAGDHIRLPAGHKFVVYFRDIPNWLTPDPIEFKLEQDGQTITAAYQPK